MEHLYETIFGSFNGVIDFGVVFLIGAILFQLTCVVSMFVGTPFFFIKHQGVWELAGVMFAVAVVQNQPARTAAYDNLTYAADLSHYRSQILEIITPNCGNGHLTVDEECDPGSETANGCCTSTCEFAARGAVCDDGDPCSDGDQCDPTGLCLPGARDLCDRGAPDSPPKP